MTMTGQEIFTTVVIHLFTQKCGSYSLQADGCAYRGMCGRKCAIGCLITDDIYEPAMESKNISKVIAKFSSMQHFAEHELLLSELQSAHDKNLGSFANLWRNHKGQLTSDLRAIAKNADLIFPEHALLL